MTDHTILTCDDCGSVLIDCECETGRPVPGDLVTRDMVEFHQRGGASHPVVVVPGQDWQAAVLAWMYLRGIYTNVWWIDDADQAQPLGLGLDDQEEPHA